MSDHIFENISLDRMARALRSETESLEWLVAKNPKLGALSYAILNKHMPSLEFLKKENEKILLAVYYAVEEEDRGSFEYLLQEHPRWAAAVSYGMADFEAMNWLIKEAPEWIEVAKIFRERIYYRKRRDHGYNDGDLTFF